MGVAEVLLLTVPGRVACDKAEVITQRSQIVRAAGRLASELGHKDYSC